MEIQAFWWSKIVSIKVYSKAGRQVWEEKEKQEGTGKLKERPHGDGMEEKGLSLSIFFPKHICFGTDSLQISTYNTII